MNKIHRRINKSNKKLVKQKTKKSLMDDVKRLFKTASKFINNNLICKFTKHFAKHILPTL